MPNPPKPLNVLKLEGTYRPDRHSGLCEDPAPEGFPSCPEYLCAIAQRKWAEVQANDIGVIRQIDAGTLEMYCRLWAELQTDGTEMAATRIALMHKLGQSLYLDPASRVKLNTGNKEEKPSNPFGQF